MRFILLGLTFWFVAGCTILDPKEDDLAEKVAEAAKKWCSNTDPNWRADFLEKVKKYGDGAYFESNCP